MQNILDIYHIFLYLVETLLLKFGQYENYIKIGETYLAEHFCQITHFLAEQFCQIALYLAEHLIQKQKSSWLYESYNTGSFKGKLAYTSINFIVYIGVIGMKACKYASQAYIS